MSQISSKFLDKKWVILIKSATYTPENTVPAFGQHEYIPDSLSQLVYNDVRVEVWEETKWDTWMVNVAEMTGFGAK